MNRIVFERERAEDGGRWELTTILSRFEETLNELCRQDKDETLEWDFNLCSTLHDRN